MRLCSNGGMKKAIIAKIVCVIALAALAGGCTHVPSDSAKSGTYQVIVKFFSPTHMTNQTIEITAFSDVLFAVQTQDGDGHISYVKGTLRKKNARSVELAPIAYGGPLMSFSAGRMDLVIDEEEAWNLACGADNSGCSLVVKQK